MEGRHVVRVPAKIATRQQRAEQEHHRHRVVEQLDERLRAGRDGVAEEVRRARPEDASGRDGVAPGPPAVGPLDRRRPLRLQVRPRRAVEERRLQLAPAPLERDPRVGAAGGVGVARDRLDVGPELDVRAAGVVAADPGLGRAADVERLRELVRVRAGGRVDDRVRPVDDLQLLLAPRRFLGALVRAVADGDRLAVERRARVVGLEDELDHLPVALVQVVELVERIEEPVLERDLARAPGVGRDVGVDGRLAVLGEAPRPVLVAAAGVERVAREVEVVVEAVDEVLGRRADLHQVGRVPRAAQRNGRLVEQHVHVGRLPGLARAALLLLLDEPDDRREPLGQRALVGEVGVSDRGGGERHRNRNDEQGRHARHQNDQNTGTRKTATTPNRASSGRPSFQ